MGREWLADDAERNEPGCLHTGDEPEHQELGEQVGAGRQAGGPFPAVDGTLLDQFPHGVGGTGEAGADDQDQQRLLGGFVGDAGREWTAAPGGSAAPGAAPARGASTRAPGSSARSPRTPGSRTTA